MLLQICMTSYFRNSEWNIFWRGFISNQWYPKKTALDPIVQTKINNSEYCISEAVIITVLVGLLQSFLWLFKYDVLRRYNHQLFFIVLLI